MTASDPQTARFAPVVENLAPARNFVRDYLTSCRWPGRDLDVVIAVGEVLQNIIRHGFGGGTQDGGVVMTASIEETGVLVVIIEDTARSSIPAEWSGEGREAHQGGLGLGIVRRIASDVIFEPIPTGNRATLRFTPD